MKTLVLTPVAQCVDMRLAGKWHVTSALLFIVHMITIFLADYGNASVKSPGVLWKRQPARFRLVDMSLHACQKLTRTKKQIGILESAFEISYA